MTFWRGERYEGSRLLLLGESAYSWQEGGKVVAPSPQHATQLVHEAINDFPSSALFMKTLSRALALQISPNKAQLEQAWATVAFGNYVSQTVGIGPRVRPLDQLWADARQTFPYVLSNLRPKTVIVLGKEMWKQMPDADLWLTDDVQGYRLPNGEFAICWTVSHPAAGLSWQRLARVIAFASERQILHEI